VLVHVPQRARRSHEANGRKQRTLLVELLRVRLAHERGEALGLEAHLELQKARARTHLLEGAVDAVVVRRRAGILDRTDKELRRRVDLLAGEVFPAPHSLRDGDELDRVEIEYAARLG